MQLSEFLAAATVRIDRAKKQFNNRRNSITTGRLYGLKHESCQSYNNTVYEATDVDGIKNRTA